MILKQENKGVYDSRNVIINSIQGDYLCFVDSDDFVAPNYIEKLMNVVASAGEKTISYCKYLKFKGKIPEIPETIAEPKALTENLLEKSLRGEFGHNICGKLIAADLIRGGVYVDERNGFDDAQLIPQICKNAKQIIRVDDVVYYYRMRAGSIMHSNNFPLFQALRSYEYYLSIAKEYSNVDTQLFLEAMILFQKMKLCCVNYDDNYRKKNYYHSSKRLREFLRSHNIKILDKKMKFSIIFPILFKVFYKIKRLVRW